MEKRISEILVSEVNEISILKLLSKEEIALLAPLFELVRIPASTDFCQQGDIINLIAIVASGKLEVKRQTELATRYLPMAILGKGAHVGEFSMLKGRPAFGTVTAVEDTELLVISHNRLEAFISRHPGTGVRILKGIAGVLSIRLEKAIEKVAHLS